MMTDVPRTMIPLVVALCSLLAACDDPKAASNANFKKALQSYYDIHPVCLKITQTLPVEIYDEPSSTGRPQLDALTKIGLLTATPVHKIEDTALGRNQHVDYIRYSVAPSAGTFVQKPTGADTFFGGTNICFAQRKVDAIKSFTEPADANGLKVSQVVFADELVDVAPWVRNAAIQAAFPSIGSYFDKSSGTWTDTLVLTGTGWKLQQELR